MYVGGKPLAFRAMNRLANAREGSSLSQYHADVMVRPCATFRPNEWISDRNTSSPASFCPPATMPNSPACLIELMVSPPALAKPMTFAFEACACSKYEEKS